MSSPFRKALIASAALIVFAGCERESRRFREVGPAMSPTEVKRVSGLEPGPAQTDIDVENPYGANAYAIAQGQRLFAWMNCVGCHAHGGGAIGPPLMDGEWIYGGEPENIFASIVEGRPNGMPAYRGKLPDYQIWFLVAYVQSLSGHVRKDAAPGRADSMHIKQRELAKETEPIRGEPAR